MNLESVLINKAKKNELGHFYILETPSLEGEAPLRLFQFIENFVHSYYRDVEGITPLQNILDYPDVYILGNTFRDDEENEDKAFKVEDAEAFARFFEFKSVGSKRKIAIITEAHRVNTIVANKWLKLLEEPNGNSTIFMLNPRGGQLLPTIHSRAIHLRLNSQSNSLDFTLWNEFSKDLRTLSLSAFLDKYTKSKQELSFWVNELIRWESSQTEEFTSKEELINWLKLFQEMELFHQPSATKWTLFYSFLKENISSRLN